MAATLIKTGTMGTGSPLLAYQLYAEQVESSGTSRTVKITVNLKCNGTSSASFYAYPCNWRAVVNGVYGSYEAIKTSTKWYGNEAYRTFSQTIKVDVGTTSSKAITVGFQANHGTYTSWNGTATGSFTVSSTNTAPVMNGYITCRATSSTGQVITAASNGTENEVKIPENISKIHLSWPAASDKEGGTIKYEVQHQRDNGSWVVIYEGTATNYTHSIGTGNQGSTYDYSVKAYDNKGLKSNTINATQFQKNKFTGNTLSSNDSIVYSDGNEKISFAFSGESNTTKWAGNNTFTRKLECSGITVYNGTVTKSPVELTIHKSGAVPTTPYILFSDVVKKFESSSYKGNLAFSLSTTNAYGSTVKTTKSIPVNIQVKPTPCSNVTISNVETESTMIKTTSSTGLKYYIPNGTDVVRVKWSAASDKLGNSISYDVYSSSDGSVWQLEKSNLTSLYFDHKIEKLSKKTTLTYKVRAKTAYGLYDETISATPIVLDYYNAPTLVQGTITRGADSASAIVTIKSDTSILNVCSSGTWKCYDKESKVMVSSGRISSTQGKQTLEVTNLTEDGSYNLEVIFTDDTGFSTPKVQAISITANLPLVFVNKYGLGVNGYKATSERSFRSRGNASIDGVLYADKVTLNNRVGGSAFGLEESSGDVYLANNVSSPNWLRLKQDGTMSWAGKEIYNTGHATPNESANKLVLRDGSGNFKAKSATFSDWVRTTGNTGWLSETHGGGWHMIDSTWIRAYKDKGIYTGGEIKGKTLTATGNITVGGTSKFTGTVTTDGTVQVGSQLKIGGTNKDVAASAIWSDNAVHNWFDKTPNNEVKFGAAKQTSFDSTTMLRGTCVRIYAHGKVNSSFASGVFLGSSGSVAVTSDENLKDIYYMDDRYLDFFDNLEPILYQYKGDHFHRLHAGYGARASERALLDANIPTEDFGGIIRERDVWIDIDGEGEKHYADIYSLRYEEFIAINSFAIKRNRETIKELQATIEKLSKKIDSLESA